MLKGWDEQVPTNPGNNSGDPRKANNYRSFTLGHVFVFSSAIHCGQCRKHVLNRLLWLVNRVKTISNASSVHCVSIMSGVVHVNTLTCKT